MHERHNDNLQNEFCTESLKVLKDIKDILVKTANRVHEGFVHIEKREDKNEAAFKAIANNINLQLRNFAKVGDKLVNFAKHMDLYLQRQESTLKLFPQITNLLNKLAEREQKYAEILEKTNNTTQYITTSLKSFLNRLGFNLVNYIERSLHKQIAAIDLPATQRVFKDLQTTIAKEFQTALLFSKLNFDKSIRITEQTLEDIARNIELDDFQKAMVKRLDQLAVATEKQYFKGKDWYTSVFELLFSINRILFEILLATDKYSSLQTVQLSELSNVVRILDQIRYIDKNIQTYYVKTLDQYKDNFAKLPFYMRFKIWRKNFAANPLLQAIMTQDLTNKSNIDFLNLFVNNFAKYNEYVKPENILLVELIKRANLTPLEVQALKDLAELSPKDQAKIIERLQKDFATKEELLKALITNSLPETVAKAEDKNYYQLLVRLATNKIVYDLRFALSDVKSFKFMYNQYAGLGLRREFQKALEEQMYALNKYYYRNLYNAMYKFGGITREVMLSSAALGLISAFGPIGAIVATPILISSAAYILFGKEWFGKWLVKDFFGFIRNLPITKQITANVKNFIQKNVVQRIRNWFTELNKFIDNDPTLKQLKTMLITTGKRIQGFFKAIVRGLDTITAGYFTAVTTKIYQVSKTMLKGLGLGFISGFIFRKRQPVEPKSFEETYNLKLGQLQSIKQVTLQTIHEDFMLLLESLPKLLNEAVSKIRISLDKKFMEDITTYLTRIDEKFIIMFEIMFGRPGVDWTHNMYMYNIRRNIMEAIINSFDMISPIKTTITNFAETLNVKLATDKIKLDIDCSLCDYLKQQISILQSIYDEIQSFADIRNVLQTIHEEIKNVSKTIKSSTLFGFLSKLFSFINPVNLGGKAISLLLGLLGGGSILKLFSNLFSKSTTVINRAGISGITSALSKLFGGGTASTGSFLSRLFGGNITGLFGKGLIRGLPLGIGGIVTGITEYMQTGSIGKSIVAGLGGILGTLAGGALGSLLGVPGAIAGGAIGGALGSTIFSKIYDFLSDALSNIFQPSNNKPQQQITSNVFPNNLPQQAYVPDRLAIMQQNDVIAILNSINNNISTMNTLLSEYLNRQNKPKHKKRQTSYKHAY